MKKIALALALLLMVAASGMFTSADIPADSFSRFLGTDCVAYLEFGNIFESNDRAKELAIYRLFTDPEMRKFFKTAAEGEEEIGEPVDEINMEKVEELMAECRDLFAGRMAVAIYPGDEGPSFLISLNIPEGKRAAVETFLADIEKKGQEIFPKQPDDPEMTIKRETVEIAGKQAVKLTSHTDEFDERISYYIVLDGYVLVSSDISALANVLPSIDNPPAESLYNDPGFVSATKSFPTKEFVAYVNTKVATKDMPDETKAMTEIVKGVSLGLSFEGRDIVDELRVFVEGIAGIPILGQMVGKRCEAKAAKFFPQKAKLFVSAALPPMEQVWPIISEIGPIGMIDQMAVNMIGVSLGEALAPSIGSEISIYADMNGPLPEFVVALDLTNPDTVLDLFSKFAEVPELGIKQFDFKEHTFFMFTNAPPLFQINVTVHEGFLLIGTAAAVKITISRTEADCLLLNETWKKAWDEASADAPAFFLFFDINKFVSQSYDTALGTVVAFTGADLASLPPKELLTDNLTTIALWMNVQQDKVAMKGRGFVGMSILSLSALVPMWMMLTLGQPGFDDMPPDWEDEEPIEDEDEVE